MIDDIRICFLGDSLVNGIGDESFLGWAGRLCKASKENPGKHLDITYYNLGIRRNTSTDILNRWNLDVKLRFKEEADTRIVFSFGVNDVVLENENQRVGLDDSIMNFNNILTKSARMFPTIFIGPPPVNEKETNERIKKLNQIFSVEAEKLGIPYIDVFSNLIIDDDYLLEIQSNDGSHPKSTGYQKIADLILRSGIWWF